jgi:type II secretory pathway pseudopilin PulG
MRGAIGVLSRRLPIHSEGGFTLVELMVAVGVMLVALLAMFYTTTIGFTDIALSRQRQSANGLANQAIEEIRALPFDTLTKGLASWDVSGDSRIVACGALKCFGGERIPTSGYPVGTNIVPLVPHTRTLTVGPTTYTVAVYVTYYQNDVNTNTFRLTSIVNWPSTVRQGASTEVQTQTIAFSPEGCLSTDTHPFAAPCQPFLYATAAADEGAIEISGPIEGLDLERSTLQLTGQTSTMQVEQIWATQGTAKTTGVGMKRFSSSEQTVGRTQVASGADNDPSQAESDFQTKGAPPPSQSGGSLSRDSGQNRMTVTVGGGSTAQTTSTTSASITPSHPCADPDALVQNDSLPCGNSNAWQAGAMSATVELDHGSAEFGTLSLALLAAAPTPTVAFTNRAILPEGTTCAGAVGDGCVHAEVRRSLGELTLATLPTGLDPLSLPAGWGGYLVRLTGFSDAVVAEGGWGTAPPSVAATGTISYWNGAGYSSLAVTVGDDVALAVAPVHVEDVDDDDGDPITVDITATLSTGGTSTTSVADTCDPACPTTLVSAAATSNSPILGTIEYVVTQDEETIADLVVQVNLGPIIAKATYQSAPSGGLG